MVLKPANYHKQVYSFGVLESTSWKRPARVNWWIFYTSVTHSKFSLLSGLLWNCWWYLAEKSPPPPTASFISALLAERQFWWSAVARRNFKGALSSLGWVFRGRKCPPSCLTTANRGQRGQSAATELDITHSLSTMSPATLTVRISLLPLGIPRGCSTYLLNVGGVFCWKWGEH